MERKGTLPALARFMAGTVMAIGPGVVQGDSTLASTGMMVVLGSATELAVTVGLLSPDDA